VRPHDRPDWGDESLPRAVIFKKKEDIAGVTEGLGQREHLDRPVPRPEGASPKLSSLYGIMAPWHHGEETNLDRWPKLNLSEQTKAAY